MVQVHIINYILLLVSLFVATVAVPTGPEVYLLRNELTIHPNGNYKFAYELSDQQKREEDGQVIPIDPETSELVVNGSFSYVGPDGITYTVHYIADRNGFQPYGDHLPQLQQREKIPFGAYGPAGFQPPETEKPLAPHSYVGISQKALLSLVG